MNRDNFNGSTYDAESDLQMLGFRMYDNETGRFTTPDLLWSAFPAQTPYHYAYNSPLTYRDPSGLAPEKEKEREELQWNITEEDLEYLENAYRLLSNHNDARSADRDFMKGAFKTCKQAWNERPKDDKNDGGGDRTGGSNSSAENGQGGDKTDGNTNGDKKDEKESEEVGWFGKLIQNISGLFGKNVNDGDAKYAEDNPKEGAIVTRNASITGNSVDQAIEDETFGKRNILKPNDQPEDEYDAYRHIVWSALNAWSLGEVEAWKAGNAHENYSGNNPASKRMDLRNNEIGYEIGGSLRNGGINNYMDALRIISLTAKSIIKSGNATVNSPIKKK